MHHGAGAKSLVNINIAFEVELKFVLERSFGLIKSLFILVIFGSVDNINAICVPHF